MVWLDEYERRARLIPGLWMIAPVVVLLMMFGLRTSPVISGLSGLLVTAGGPVLLSSFVRHRGLKAQTDLLAEWGGWPTTTILATGSPSVLAARRAAVSVVTGLGLPPADQPDDDGYAAAIEALRAKTRDTARFPLVFTENCNFGRERNFLGVQRLALRCAVLALVLGVATTIPVAIHRDSLSADLWLGLVLLAGLVAFWSLYPSRERAHSVAGKYAERLVEAAAQLSNA